MPSFLMPPLNIWNRQRVPGGRMASMEGTTKQLMFPRRNVVLRTLHNVFVAAEGLVIHQDGTVEPSTVRQHSEADILTARAQVAYRTQIGAIPRYEGDCVLCRRPGSHNYGHWLAEMLPIAYVAAQHWPKPARFLVQAAEEPLAGIMREGFDRLGIAAGQRIVADRLPILVERLVLVEGLTDHGSYIAPLAFEALDRIAANIAAGPDRRLFVSRGQARTRRLVREAAIIAHAAERGYVCIQPGEMSLSAQIAAFKGASRIIGVMGAALSNLIFAVPGTEVFMLSPAAMPDTFFWFICGWRGLRVTDIRCESGPPPPDTAEWNGDLTLDAQDEAAMFTYRHPPPAPGLFDPAFYAADLPPGADPLEHYCAQGWREGRDPSPHFSTSGYLAAYPDIAAAGMNPLLHYIEHGRAEGRSPRP